MPFTSACKADLTIALSDREVVERAERCVRSALLQALSEVRAMTLKMEPRYRDKLVDEVTRYFHPDNLQSDSFVDCFHPLKVELDEVVETRESESGLRAAE